MLKNTAFANLIKKPDKISHSYCCKIVIVKNKNCSIIIFYYGWTITYHQRKTRFLFYSYKKYLEYTN